MRPLRSILSAGFAATLLVLGVIPHAIAAAVAAVVPGVATKLHGLRRHRTLPDRPVTVKVDAPLAPRLI